jgi:hypothetical protein
VSRASRTSKPVQSASHDENQIAREIEIAEREINSAIDRRDLKMLERRLADSFIHIHTLGPIESRDVFAERVAAGTALSRQRTADWTEFDVTLNSFDGHTVIRRSRLRFRSAEQKRERWLFELKVFIKHGDFWRLASWHGTTLHQGPIVDATAHQKLAGEYVSDSGQRLPLVWNGWGILATWPEGIGSGALSQIFSVSDTEFEDGVRKLRFTIDADRTPVRVVVSVNGKDVWQGTRSK